jgi:hypothetical protein
MNDLFDPTLLIDKISFSQASRPKRLTGLRLGLVDNTKHNSNVLLMRIAQELRKMHKMEVAHFLRKESASAMLTEGAIVDFVKKGVDVAIAGIGD